MPSLARAAAAAALLAALVGTACAEEEPTQGRILALSMSNLTAVVEQHPLLVVRVCATSSARCRVSAPEFEALLATLPTLPKPVQLASIDVSYDKDVADLLEVRSIPSVIHFRNGSLFFFNGALTTESLVALVRSETGLAPGSPAKRLEGVPASLKWTFWRGDRGDNSLEPTVVGLFPPGTRAAAQLTGEEAAVDGLDEAAAAAAEAAVASYRALVDVARSMPLAFRFSESEDPEVAAALGAGEEAARGPVFLLYRDFDERKNVWKGEHSAEQLRELLSTHAVPTVAVVDHQSLRGFQRLRHVLVHVFTTAEEAEDGSASNRALQQRLRRVAVQVLGEGDVARGSFTLAVSNGEKYAEWMQELGLDTSAASLPSAVAVDARKAANGGEGRLEFAYGSLDGEWEGALAEFVGHVVAGRLTPLPSGDGHAPRGYVDGKATRLHEVPREVTEAEEEELRQRVEVEVDGAVRDLEEAAEASKGSGKDEL